MDLKAIKFGQPLQSTFYKDLKDKVEIYFLKTGYGRKANGSMIIKLGIIGILFVGSYALLISNVLWGWDMVIVAFIFGFSQVLIAFNISHDASHGALFISPKLNNFFSYSFNLIGVNRYIWNIKHNLSHHAFTNVPGYDMDIEQIKIARLVPHAKLKWAHQFQHYYLPLLYPFTSLYMIFIKDFQMFATRHYGNNTYHNHPKREYWILFFSKLLYFTYALIIPIIFINLVWWKVLFGFIIMHLILGTMLAIILFPVHTLDNSPYPEPNEEGIIDNSWAIHQVETSTNFGAKSKVLCWLTGGLNTHIVHHIFPNICHIHYYELNKITRDVARRHGIKFRENTMFGALLSHLNYLRIMGKKARHESSIELLTP